MREYGDNTRDPALDEALRRGRRVGRVEIVAWTAGFLCLCILIIGGVLFRNEINCAVTDKWTEFCLYRAEKYMEDGEYESAARQFACIGEKSKWREQAEKSLLKMIQELTAQGEQKLACRLVLENEPLWDMLLARYRDSVVKAAADIYAKEGDYIQAANLYAKISLTGEIGRIGYQTGEEYYAGGRYLDAAAAFMQAVELAPKEARQAAEERLDEMRYKTPEEVPLSTIAAGTGHTVAVRTDGTVVAVGDDRAGQCRVTDWQGVLSVAAGDGFTLGLTESGDVLFAGENDAVASAVAGWKGVRRIAAGRDCAVALLRGGRVLVAGCDNPGWTDAVSVFAGGSSIGCIQTDGTVLLSGGEKQLNVSQWKGAVVLAMSDGHAVALLSDGSTAGTGEIKYGQSRVEKWEYSLTLAASEGYTLGLLLDGSVRYAGKVGIPMTCARGWTGIVAIAAGETHAVGLREDGTVVVTGDNSYGQLNVSDWMDIRTPDKECA